MLDGTRPSLLREAEQIETAVDGLFAIQDTTLGLPDQVDMIRLRGHLLLPSDQAYDEIAERLRAFEYTLLMRRDEALDLDVLLIVPGAAPQEVGSRLWLNLVLYLLTILATLFVGATWSDQLPADADLLWVLTHLWIGWPFALSLMTILTGHEAGHYLAGRYYGVPVSLPYFIPMPFPPLGTMGAFIVMKGQTVNRRQMLMVGASGPLVGFLLAVPILILGLALSRVDLMMAPTPGSTIFVEGNSLLYLLLKFGMFGQILPGSGDPSSLMQILAEAGAALFGTFRLDQGFDVFVHPVALAGWAGLLVTALNLLPVGQLDGGHVLYSLVGRKAKLLTWPVIGVLVVLGFFLWQGWLLWAALIFFFGQSHPDPLDDITRLDTPRKIIAVLVLLVFLLTFSPQPMQIISGDMPPADAGQAVSCLGVVGLMIWGAVSLKKRAVSRRRQEQ